MCSGGPAQEPGSPPNPSQKAALFISLLPDTDASQVSTVCQQPGCWVPHRKQHRHCPKAGGCPEAGRSQEKRVSSLLPCLKGGRFTSLVRTITAWVKGCRIYQEKSPGRVKPGVKLWLWEGWGDLGGTLGECCLPSPHPAWDPV